MLIDMSLSFVFVCVGTNQYVWHQPVPLAPTSTSGITSTSGTIPHQRTTY